MLYIGHKWTTPIRSPIETYAKKFRYFLHPTVTLLFTLSNPGNLSHMLSDPSVDLPEYKGLICMGLSFTKFK